MVLSMQFLIIPEVLRQFRVYVPGFVSCLVPVTFSAMIFRGTMSQSSASDTGKLSLHIINERKMCSFCHCAHVMWMLIQMLCNAKAHDPEGLPRHIDACAEEQGDSDTLLLKLEVPTMESMAS